MHRRIIAVDFDGTLVDKLEGPIIDRIKYINNLHEKGHFIVIYTTRPEKRRCDTEYLLKKTEVKYDVIVFDKLHFDLYIDESKMVAGIEKLLKGGKPNSSQG